ncbi:NYN domain-containing protein [Christensenella timonensis]|uniref:NYN domain-containing protein n=1 Tax=Christensenella timonensis TaxID=1816678 RepID=UPI00082F07BB|nr:NYN domain-containing protein [Christensenella timonensis]
MDNNDKRIAVLIDADNVSDKYVKLIFDEISNYGTPTYKRIYGDWTTTQNSSWKKVLLDYSIAPIQQYGYTKGKNSTDSALIIDAMDILYSGNVDGFCIVSSDSDFTRLAARLRESGMLVIGMGEQKTPAAFIAACEIFRYLEVLAQSTDENTEAAAEETDKEEKAGPAKANKQQLTRAIKAIVNDISDDDGWAFLGAVGNRLNKRYPDFDSRNYGYAKLTQLVEALKQFDIDTRKTANPHIKHKFIRNKQDARQSKKTR